MPEETNATNPEAPPPAPPPLRAAFLVWPGKSHGQTWMFLWLGVAFLIGSLLPWHGANDVEYVLSTPYRLAEAVERDGVVIPEQTTRTLSAVHYRMAIENSKVNPNLYPRPGNIIAVRDPGMSFGAVLLLLASIAMVVVGVTNVWSRRLAMTPTLVTWFLAMAVIYASSGGSYDRHYAEPEMVSGFKQIGSTFQVIFGNIGDVFSGKDNVEVAETLNRFGLGYYVTMGAELFLVVFIGFSIVTGLMAAGKDDARGGGGGGGSGPARRSRTGGGFPAPKKVQSESEDSDD